MITNKYFTDHFLKNTRQETDKNGFLWYVFSNNNMIRLDPDNDSKKEPVFSIYGRKGHRFGEKFNLMKYKNNLTDRDLKEYADQISK